MTKIDERTSVSLFAVLIAIPTLVFAVMTFAALSARVERAEAKALENSGRIEGQMSVLIDIRERLIRIEEKVKPHK